MGGPPARERERREEGVTGCVGPAGPRWGGRGEGVFFLLWQFIFYEKLNKTIKTTNKL